MKNNKLFLCIIIIAVLIKITLFSILTIYAPEYKFENDSFAYINTAATLYQKGVFAQVNGLGVMQSEVLRTPGYPLFLAIFHNFTRIPFDGIILLQIFLGILAALIVYKAAGQVDNRLCSLSAAIVLLDFPIHRYSLILMTEILFLLFMSLFLFSFIKFLKNGENKWLIFSALILSLSVYIRPIGYYLGAAIAVFLVYANALKNYKKSLIQAVIFLAVVYVILGGWQLRNYKCCGNFSFSSVTDANFNEYGLMKGSVLHKDINSQGLGHSVFYHADIVSRSFLNFMVRPGSLKYLSFGNLNDIIFCRFLKVIFQILSYLVMIFWLIGFIVGVAKIRRNIYCQFMLFVILYFLCATIANIALLAGERFRIPTVPFIAIISAYGWLIIQSFTRGIILKIKKVKVRI